jgi:predicted transcriptional regulator
MDQGHTSVELLNFFKALADANRLKIVGLLAREPLSVEQLAELLDLHPSTVSHHLARLSKAGLVSARAEGYYNIYQLEEKVLEKMSQRLLARETLPVIAADVDMDAYDRKVINTYFDSDGRLKAFPTQQKKLEVVLRYVLRAFELDVRYTEKQVNAILGRFNEDTAGLRRDLVDFGMLRRNAGGREYWRPSAT